MADQKDSSLREQTPTSSRVEIDSTSDSNVSAARPTTRDLLRRKQRRLGEKVIEWGIRAIAALSIIFIFLIFYFVFREASPIFLGKDKEAKDTVAATAAPTTAPADTSLAQEQYTGSSDTTATTKSNDSGSNAGSNEPDVYNPDAKLASDDTSSKRTASAVKDSLRSPIGSNESDVYNPGATLASGNSDSTATASSPTGTPAESTKAPSARDVIGPDYPILSRDSPVKLSYLAHDIWQPNSEYPRYGIYPILIGTAKTTFVALLIAVPLGILAALYTAFFAPKRAREILKPIIEILAGFPSVVIGFFSLMTVASIVQSVFGNDYRLNAVVGGIGLSLAVIPIIYTITDDALRAVPKSLREAALALGASEWQAAYQVMLPAATPGIFAAVLLGLGRAFGETMIALMACGNASTVSWNFFDSVRTFAATIGAEMGEVVFGSPHYQVLFLLGVILFIFSFAINFVTEFYVKQRLIKRFRGAA